MARALGLTRICVVDDHGLFAEALDVALTLRGYVVERLSPAASAAHGRLLAQVLRTRPKVVLLDLDLGGHLDGGRLVEPLARASIHVVVLTSSTDEARWGECLRHGARVVLPKTSQLNTVLAAVRLIGEGRPVLAREERERLVATFHRDLGQRRTTHAKLDRLSPREREVLGQLMSGAQVVDIARTFVVSEATVRTQVKSILAKLGVPSQLTAVGLAYRSGWRPPLPPGAAHP